MQLSSGIRYPVSCVPAMNEYTTPYFNYNIDFKNGNI